MNLHARRIECGTHHQHCRASAIAVLSSGSHLSIDKKKTGQRGQGTDLALEAEWKEEDDDEGRMILQTKALLHLLHRLCPAPVMLSCFSSARAAAGVVPVGVHCSHGQHAAKVRRPKRELRLSMLRILGFLWSSQHASKYHNTSVASRPRPAPTTPAAWGQRSRWCQRARREPSAAVDRQKE